MDENELHDIIIQMMHNEPKGVVLDMGAGKGALSERLNNLGFEVIACDLDADKFKLSDVAFVYCNLNKPLSINMKFDYICTSEVIEHLENPYKFVRDCHFLLKDDGKVIITTPNISSYKSRILFFFFGRFYEFFPWDKVKSGHINPIPYWELRDILEENGFKIEVVTTNKLSLRAAQKYSLKSFILNFIYLIGLISLLFIRNKGFEEIEGKTGDNLIVKAVKTDRGNEG